MTLMLKRRRTRGNTTIVNVPGGGEEGDSTFDAQGRWTPLKDGNGDVTNAEWNGLPLNTWIQWGGATFATGSTRLDLHLSTPFGTTAPYNPLGSNPTTSHYDNYTGCGFDETNGVFYHFGGGHAGGSNNMLTKFEAKKGIHSVVIPPTPSSAYPSTYDDAPLSLSDVNYGGPTQHYFRSDQTPVGDDKPAASHEYGGIVFIPGINEVIMARHGWFHAQIGLGTWRVGPQVAVADRLQYSNRDGLGFRCFYIASTARVYMLASGSAPHNGAVTPFVCVVYDPATRDETTAFGLSGFSTHTYSNACLAPATVGAESRVMWYFQGPFGDSTTYTVAAVNLTTGTTSVANTAVLGRKPARTDASDGDNPCQYIPDLDTILIWCTVSNASSGAVTGEMLNFNRTTRTCSLFTMAGTPPPNTGATRANMNNKMRYWPERKVLLFQTATNINCYLIKLA